MNRRPTGALFAVLVLLAVSPVTSQEALWPSVFLETVPLGASVRLDNTARAEKTPVLLRGLKDGRHTVVLYKAGFRSQTLTFDVNRKRVTVVRQSLEPDSVVAAFPANPKFQSFGGAQDTLSRQFRLPAGRYLLGTTDTTVSAAPVFVDEPLTVLAPWLSWGLFTAAAVSSGADAWGMTQYQLGLSPATPLLLTAAAEGVLWTWALGAREKRWDKERAAVASPLDEKAEFSGPLAGRAEALQSQGNLDGAAQLYGQLVRDYPEAAEAPEAWFRLARIHALKGERELARGQYRLVAETLQAAALFDRAHKALADLAEADGNFSEASYHVAQIAFADNFFERSFVEAELKRLAEALAQPRQTNEVLTPGVEKTVDDYNTGALTVRQVWDNVTTLYGTGHTFTGAEFTRLQAYREELATAGEDQLAARLDLLTRAAALENDRADTARQLEAGSTAWKSVEKAEARRNLEVGWKGVRDIGLGAFVLSGSTALTVAANLQRLEPYAPENQKTVMRWTLFWSSLAMALSVVPMVSGEFGR